MKRRGNLIGWLHLDLLLADGVVASSVVVRRVLFPRDQLLGVEQLPVSSSSNLIRMRSRRFDLGPILNSELTSSTTVGSKSTKTALGTCFPDPVVAKNVVNESSAASSWYSCTSKLGLSLVRTWSNLRNAAIGVDSMFKAVKLPRE